MLTQPDYQTRATLLRALPTRPRSDLLRFQNDALARLVRHAANHVPYYRNLFQNAKLDPSSIQTVADLRRVPISSRQELSQEPLERLMTAGISEAHLAVSRSSGSTGRPMASHHTALERRLLLSFRHRTILPLLPPRAAVLAYVGMDSRTEKERAATGNSTLASVPGASMELHIIECRRPVQNIIKDLLTIRAQVIFGYPSVLVEITAALAEADLARLKPEVISCGGESVTPFHRQLLKKTFGAQVTSTYACTEIFWIGGECSQTGELHLVDDSVIAEVVGEDGCPVAPGERGSVLVTSLVCFGQPFLRYRIGDVAIQGAAPVGGDRGCRCGSPFSTIGYVYGREMDYLTLPSGERVHPYVLSIPIKQSAGFVQQFQIIQESIDHIVVRCVRARERDCDPTPDEIQTARLALAAELGEPVNLEFDFVSELPREANGKFRTVVSKVGQRQPSPALSSASDAPP